jgi:hypothetical protein
MPETVSDNEPLFVSVTASGALVTPTVSPAKSRLVGEREATGAWPVPLSETVCGFDAALSLMVSVPDSELFRLGLKVTLMVQLALAASELGQLFVWGKSALFAPVTTMLEMVSGPGPLFVSVTA